MRQLRKDTVKAYQFFSLARKGGILFLGIYLAKTGWSLEKIGYWEGLLFSVTLLGSFWLEAWVKTFLTEAREHNDQLTSLFRWIVDRVFLFALLTGSLWWFGKSIWELFLLPHVPLDWAQPFILFAALWLPTLILPAYYLSREKAGALWLLSVYYLIGFPLSFIIFDQQYPMEYQALLGLMIWVFPLVIILSVEYFSKYAQQQSVNTKQVWVKWRTLLVYSLLAVMAPLIDAWLVQFWYNDPSVFAMFRYGARELPLVGTLAAGLSTAMIPQFSQDWQGSLAELRTRIRRLVIFLYPPVILIIIFAPVLYEYVFSQEFISSSYIFQIYLMLTISQLLIVQPLVLARGKEKWLVQAAVGELIANLMLSLILGYYFGVIGIAWATVLAFIYEKAFLAYRIKRHFGIGLMRYYPKLGILMTVVLLVIYFLSTELNHLW